MPRQILRIAALLLFLGLAAMAGAQQASAQRSVEEIEKIVREYLLENPEVIFEAVQRHRAKQQEQQAERDQTVLRKHRNAILADPHSFVGGNPDGDVTLVEFFDYRCGYCKRFAPTLEAIKKQDPKLRVVYKEWPILGPDSMKGAQAALAAREQGRYVEFHEALMRVKGNLDDETIMAVARSVGLDTERLGKDMQSPTILKAIGDTRKLAAALGITGTPALIVGDQIVRGLIPLEQLARMIAAARAKGS
ncbi:MAG: DsbA family protein [Deltaproteobacteria bacterium]|nr:DsbA family protein [Deltaproteobacteria bacterium]